MLMKSTVLEITYFGGNCSIGYNDSSSAVYTWNFIEQRYLIQKVSLGEGDLIHPMDWAFEYKGLFRRFGEWRHLAISLLIILKNLIRDH